MFSLSNRRYTGAKTRLLDSIDTSILKSFNYRERKNLSFFDVFSGTGVVSEYFAKKKEFSKIIINDFLHSNFIVYQGFFDLKNIRNLYALCKTKNNLSLMCLIM